MRAVLACAALLGCYAPTITPGAPCSSDGRCPGDLVCDPLAIDGPTCVRPGDEATDADEDGVSDELDNCADVANPEQHDEDDDGHGNVCDGCPHIADPVQPDVDDDGVNDACDPGGARHAIVAFEGFDESGLPAGWQPNPDGVWTAAGDGVLRVAAETDRIASFSFASVNKRTRISTRFTVEVVNPPGGTNNRNVGTAHQFDPATNDGTGCLAILDYDLATHTLWLLNLSPVVTLDRMPFGDFAVGSIYEMTTDEFDAGGAASVRCASTFEGATLTLEDAIDSRATGPRVGLRVRGSSARFDYVVLVGEQ
jgi:hypothetical protein